MKNLECAICGKKGKLRILYKANFDPHKINEKTFSARRISDIFHYQLNKCLRCGLIFSSPILEEKKINLFYSKSEFNYDKETKYLRKTYGFYLKKYYRHSLNNSKALDVGCGNGFFLEELKSLGTSDVFGVEPSKDAISKIPRSLKDKIKRDILKPSLFSKSCFNLITCFHTLDHVIEPNTFIKTIYNFLKKDGVAYFIVHDTDGLSVKIFKEKSPIFDIEHVYLFNKESLKKIFLKNGFKKAEVFSVCNIYPLQYWIYRSPLPHRITDSFIKILAFTKLAQLPISINAGNIGIMAYK